LRQLNDNKFHDRISLRIVKFDDTELNNAINSIVINGDYADIIAIMRGVDPITDDENSPERPLDPSIRYVINQTINLIVWLSFDFREFKGAFLHMYHQYLELTEEQQQKVRINLPKLLSGDEIEKMF
jgi:hypothetical protein